MKEYVLPFRDLVVHPGLTVPVYIDNPMSIACIEAAMDANRRLVLAAQHSWNYPAEVADIYDVGTIGDIAQVLRMPDGAIHAIIRTTDVVSLHDITVNKICLPQMWPLFRAWTMQNWNRQSPCATEL